MKNLMAGLLTAAVLLPAAQVRNDETQRGHDEIITTAADSIKNAADANKSHTWVKMAGKYNLRQQYAAQREMEKKGYVIDVPMFGSAFVGW